MTRFDSLAVIMTPSNHHHQAMVVASFDQALDYMWEHGSTIQSIVVGSVRAPPESKRREFLSVIERDWKNVTVREGV